MGSGRGRGSPPHTTADKPTGTNRKQLSLALQVNERTTHTVIKRVRFQVLDQWLLADLRDLGHPVLPGHLSGAQKTELTGTFCVQVSPASVMYALILYLYTHTYCGYLDTHNICLPGHISMHPLAK